MKDETISVIMNKIVRVALQCVRMATRINLGALLRALPPKEHKEDLTMAKSKCTNKKFSDVVKSSLIAAKNWLTPTRVISIVCLLLMIGLVVTQFLPYWSFGEGEKAQTLSIFQHNWFPNEKAYKSTFIKEMKNQLVENGLMDAASTELKKLAINDFVYPHALLFLVSVFGIAFGPFKLGKPLGVAFNLAVAGFGIWQYLCHPIYQLGQNWYIGLIIAIALAVLSLLNVALLIVKKLKD